jgi:hypothetical protein
VSVPSGLVALCLLVILAGGSVGRNGDAWVVCAGGRRSEVEFGNKRLPTTKQARDVRIMAAEGVRTSEPLLRVHGARREVWRELGSAGV